MTNGIHHPGKRSGRVKHKDRWLNALDSLVFIVALFGVVMTIPQVAEIWLLHNASGVSLISWASYTVASSFWVVYGVVHREKVVLSINALYTVLNALVVVGILAYG